MEPSLFKKYMQNIEDFVFIEERIVTYLWLCQVLKIHVNTAKQLLYAFSTKNGVKSKLLLTYVLGGELKHGKGKLLKLVIGDSKEAVKQLFSKITTDHIYSVQLSGGSFSPNDIYNSYPHFTVPHELRKYCPIQANKEVKKREVKTVTELKNFLDDKPVKKQIISKINEEPKKDLKEDGNKNDVNNEPPQKQRKLSGNEKEIKSKAGSIDSFFGKQAEKKNSETTSGVKEKTVTKEEKAKNGINLFFKPGNKFEDSKKVSEGKEANSRIEQKEIEKEKIADIQKEDKNKEKTSSSTKFKKPKSKDKKRKRKKKDEGEDGNQKKRKRIVSVSSSDSESSGNESSDCEMEVEPEQPLPPSVIEEEEDIIPPTPGRKRIRKQIDKTFKDEDGFIITKKEYEYESCSDDEAKIEITENKENNTKEGVKTSIQKYPEKKKEISPKNVKKSNSSNNDKINKQSAITSFFKKK